MQTREELTGLYARLEEATRQASQARHFLRAQRREMEVPVYYHELMPLNHLPDYD